MAWYDGKRQEESLGWSSEGWTASKAFNLLSELKNAATTGEGATRLADKRRLAAEEHKKRDLVDNLEKKSKYQIQ